MMRVESMTAEDVGIWLEDLGLDECKPAFVSRRVNGNALFDLTDESLAKDLGVKQLCHRKLILAKLDQMKKSSRRNSFANEENILSKANKAKTIRQRSMSDMTCSEINSTQNYSSQHSQALRPQQSASPDIFSSPNMQSNGHSVQFQSRQGPGSLRKTRPALQSLSSVRVSADSTDDGAASAFGQSPSDASHMLYRRVSCSDLPCATIHPQTNTTPKLSGDSRSTSPDFFGVAEGCAYRASPMNVQTNAHVLTRSDSMSSAKSSNMVPIMQRSGSFASQMTSSSISSGHGDFMHYTRLKKFLKAHNLDLSFETVEHIYSWTVLEFLIGLLCALGKVVENQKLCTEYDRMARGCAENLVAEEYFLVSDLIADVDVEDFRNDLSKYGFNKKRLLNELRGLLEELRAFHTVNAPDSFQYNNSNNNNNDDRQSVCVQQAEFFQPPSIIPAATSSTRSSREGKFPSQVQQRKTPPRKRSVSHGTFESIFSQQSSPAFAPPLPKTSESLAAWNAQQHVCSQQPSNNFNAVAPSLNLVNSGRYSSPHSDEVSSYTECSSNASGDEGSQQGSPSSLSSSHRMRGGLRHFNTSSESLKRNLPPSTPPSRPLGKQHAYTDQPRASFDRSAFQSQAKPKSRQREEIAKVRSQKFSFLNCDPSIEERRRARHETRLRTEPLPMPSPSTANSNSSARKLDMRRPSHYKLSTSEDPLHKLASFSSSAEDVTPAPAFVSEEKYETQAPSRNPFSSEKSNQFTILQRSSSMDQGAIFLDGGQQNSMRDKSRLKHSASTSEEKEHVSQKNFENESSQRFGGELKYKQKAAQLVVDVFHSPKSIPSPRLSNGSVPAFEHHFSIDGKTQSCKNDNQSSTAASRRPLAVDVCAIENEMEIQNSFFFHDDDRALHIGKLVIPVDGGVKVKGTNTKVRRGEMQTGLRLLSHLGKGAGGTVLKAIHVPTLRIVAVKEVVVNDKSQRKQMRRELDTLLLDLDHPNVVQFYDSFYNPNAGTISMVFEYLKGGSLQDIVDKGVAVPPEKLEAMALYSFRGLSYFHKKNLIHRDIKPSNLLISEHGVVKIADFGISRDLEGSEAKCNTYLGTFQFMSPERISGEEYTVKADIWSLGLSLFTCALGHFPFQFNGGYWGLTEAIQANAFPDFPPGFPSELAEAIMKCLKRDPKERATPSELLETSYFKRIAEREDARTLERSKTANEIDTATPSKPLDEKARQELEKIVSNVSSYYRELYSQTTLESSNEPRTISVTLELGKLRTLSNQLGLPAHRVAGEIDKALQELEKELRHA